MMLVVANGPILNVLSRLDLIWLRKPNLGTWRMLRVPDLRLEGWGHLELNIKNYVGGCQGAYPESFIKIGHGLAEKA